MRTQQAFGVSRIAQIGVEGDFPMAGRGVGIGWEIGVESLVERQVVFGAVRHQIAVGERKQRSRAPAGFAVFLAEAADGCYGAIVIVQTARAFFQVVEAFGIGVGFPEGQSVQIGIRRRGVIIGEIGRAHAHTGFVALEAREFIDRGLILGARLRVGVQFEEAIGAM